jgi:hypothetical protein
MATEIWVAIIAAVVAIISAAITLYGQFQLTRQQEQHAQEARSAEIIAKYRNPLLQSAFDLQNRLYNITQLHFLDLYRSTNPGSKMYCIDNTLFVIAEYLGWIEILRHEIQFLDLGDAQQNQTLNQLLDAVKKAFSSSKYLFVFRLFNGQQRAIGELMMTPRSSEKGADSYECIGYSTFSQRLHQDEQFAQWFSDLQYDFECLVKEPEKYYDRLIVLQNSLIDLIDFLDPEQVRISTDERQKVPLRNT